MTHPTRSHITPIQFFYYVFLGVLLLVGIIVAALLTRQPQDIRQQAAPSSMPAPINLLPFSQTLPPDQTTSIQLDTDVSVHQIDGFQIVAKIWHHQTQNPVAPIGFRPQLLPGLSLVKYSFAQVPNSQSTEFNQGYYLLKLVYVTQNPYQPFSYSGPLTLGSVFFNLPSGSQVQVELDPELTKTVQHQTNSNIAELPTTPAPFLVQPLSFPADNAINWQTDTVNLTADNFYMLIDNQIYTAADATDFYLASDPGSSTYTSLEATWTEHNRQMRLHMYFSATDSVWYVDSITTYNNQAPANWLSYQTDFPSRPLGTPYTSPLRVVSTLPNSSIQGYIHFDNLSLMPFTAPSPTGQVSKLTFLTRYRSVNPATIDYIPTLLEIGPTGSSSPLISLVVNFTPTNNQLFSYTLELPPDQALFTNSHYWVRLKGEKHLARFFSNLSFTNNQTLDFSYKPQEPGDLPPQDGVANLSELDKIFAIISSSQPQTIDDLKVGDVNYDGKVNGFDIGTVITTLSAKQDESL